MDLIQQVVSLWNSLTKDAVAAPMLLKFADVYTELPQKWLLEAGIISSWENMRKHLESASK